MLRLRASLDLWEARAFDFVSGGDKDEIYHRCVLAALEDPETERLLGKRDGVTRDAVVERMRTAAYRRYATIRCPSLPLDEAVEKLDEVQDKHERAARRTQWDWRVVCSLIGFGALTVLIFGGPLALLVAVLAAAAVMFTLFWRGSVAWFNLSQCLIAGGLGVAWLVQRFEVGVCAVHWGEDLQRDGIGPVVAQLVRHMLGDDPDSLFIPDDYEGGLPATRAPDCVVENAARRQLERKLKHLKDGTIAVCGPRGAGKSTLLEQCVRKADFGVIVQAPATYTPHDFLLSLSVRLCEKYMRVQKYTPPDFAQLSPMRRLLRRVRLQAKRLGRWSSFAVPAVVLLVLGLSASMRSLHAQYATSVSHSIHMHAESVRDDVMTVWQGHAAVMSAPLTIGAIAWWRARHTTWLTCMLGRLWKCGIWCLGPLLSLASAASVLWDEQIRRQVHHLAHDTPAEALNPTIVGTVVWTTVWWLLCMTRDSGVEFPLGRWNVSLEKIFRPVAAAAGTYLLLYLIDNSLTRPFLVDPDNPLRLVGIIAGVLLSKAADWRPQTEEPELVTRCRNHLYRLQTIQQASHGLTTGGATQVLSLGTNHTTSVSTVPPTYPELVEEFRELLKDIAAEKVAPGKTVVIAIDEVDRLGTDTEALAFLREIKAILGVPRVHYLISVAEDVGAAFVRRGLPHRDVTDSSLDDIIHVQPSTLTESRAILAKRSQRLKDPHVMLAHALSGGILRDLLRYGLQLRETQDKTKSYELTHISRHLILEELAETFAGFRTLLSKQQWTPDTSNVLASFRTLCRYLRDPCPSVEADVLRTLESFAFYTHADTPADPDLTDDVRQLIDEASTYAYFSLTLLDIFSTEGLDRRTQLAAEHGPDGDPERLADARQELGISPYSARPLIDTVRKAWSLPLGPTTDGRI